MSAINRTIQSLRYKKMSFEQSENAVLDYIADYAGELQGDTIASGGSTWTEETSGLAIANESVNTANNKATAFISASDPGNYIVTNKIVTDAGRTIEVVLSITVKDNKTNLSAPDPQSGDYCR